MPPRKEKEFPKNYVESEEEKETSDDSTQDEEDDIVEDQEISLPLKPALYDSEVYIYPRND